MSAMKIPPYTTNGIESSGAAAGNSGTSDKTASVDSSTSDRVQLSQNYTNLASVQKSIMGTDNVRTDKVQQIQSQLAGGTYRVDAGEIAGKMLNEIL
ncbi:MAG: flagellar biosynthesis anti-sigma factor FlgM [Syntrophobacteraceae bacterium]